MRQGEPWLAASASATVSMGNPHHSATVAAANALATWCAPCNASRTSVCPHAPDPHLEDHPPHSLRRVEQRQREAQLVVEGTLARRGAERRRQAAGQEVLGGGLAHRPCDADRAADPIAGQRPEAQQCGGG